MLGDNHLVVRSAQEAPLAGDPIQIRLGLRGVRCEASMTAEQEHNFPGDHQEKKCTTHGSLLSNGSDPPWWLIDSIIPGLALGDKSAGLDTVKHRGDTGSVAGYPRLQKRLLTGQAAEHAGAFGAKYAGRQNAAQA